MATGGRKSHLQVMHEISVAIGPALGPQFNAQGQGGFVMGWLPAGAVLMGAHAVVSQAFNPSGGMSAAIGSTLGGSDLLSVADAKVIGRADATTAVALAGPFAAATPIYIQTNWAGGPPTLGLLTAWLEYLPGAG